MLNLLNIQPMSKTFSFIWEIAKIFILALIIVVPIRYFLFQPFIVSGDSMVPNFHSGDYLIIDEISYRFHAPERGDVIVFKYPIIPSHKFIKRIIGLPGETVSIKNNEITIFDKDGKQQTLQESYLTDPAVTYGDMQVVLDNDQYFVLGDNRPYSSDSRAWGPLPKNNIIGKVLIRIFPLAALGKIPAQTYLVY